jgi:hypothetical protein
MRANSHGGPPISPPFFADSASPSKKRPRASAGPSPYPGQKRQRVQWALLSVPFKPAARAPSVRWPTLSPSSPASRHAVVGDPQPLAPGPATSKPHHSAVSLPQAAFLTAALSPLQQLNSLSFAQTLPHPSPPSASRKVDKHFQMCRRQNESGRGHSHSLATISSSNRKPCAMPIMPRPPDISASIIA